MPQIGTLVTFSPNTYIRSADVNANFSAIVSAFNTSAVLTDLAKTITVAHTFSQGATFSGGTVNFSGATVTNLTANVAGNLTGNVTGNVSGNVTGNLTGNVTGNVSGSAATVTTAAQPAITSLGTLTSLTTSGAITMTAASSQVIPGATSWSVRNHANTRDNVTVFDNGDLQAYGAGTFSNLDITGSPALGHLFLTSPLATPSSVADGMIWFTGSALKIQIGGVTKTFTVT